MGIQYACLYLAFILAAYVTSFTRVALFLLLVHYISEAVFHTCRILAYLDKTAIASKLFKLGDALFVVARLSSVTMSVLTFWFGLASVPSELQVLDPATGNFNPLGETCSPPGRLPPASLAYVRLDHVPGEEGSGGRSCLSGEEQCGEEPGKED